MARFFVENPALGGAFSIVGSDARHIGRSLRMRVGEQISVVSGGLEHVCILEKISDGEVIARIVSTTDSREPNISLTLFQALPKLDKLENIIQKSVELGASRIVPVLTERCIARPDPEKFLGRLPRLMKISEAAAKQSGRGIIPEITGIIGFEECLKMLADCDLPLFCYEKSGGKRLTEISFSRINSVGLLIGPEGGFSEKEAKSAENAGALQIWLGDRILRCETAPVAAIAIIMSLTGNI